MKVALFLPLAILLSELVGLAAYAQSDAPGSDQRDPFGHSLKPKYLKRKKLEAKKFVPDIPEEDVIRVETRLVVDDVLVTNKDGAAVRGLTKDDFQLYEDGVEQDMAVFSLGNDSGAIGRSIVLIIDYSGSERPYIEKSIDAAKVLIDGLNPHDRMAIVTDDVEVLSNFTTDRSQLKAQLEMLKQRSLAGTIWQESPVQCPDGCSERTVRRYESSPDRDLSDRRGRIPIIETICACGRRYCREHKIYLR